MLFRFILMSLGCVAIASCSANAQPQSPKVKDNQQSAKITNIETNKVASSATDNLDNDNTNKSANKEDQSDFNSPVGNLSDVPNSGKTEELNKGNIKSPKYSATGSYMKLVPTSETNALGNPLYELDLFANGKQVGSYKVVSGRAHTQNRDRNRAGTEAPLPDGRYRVAKSTTPGTIAEAGDRFLAIQPLFRTGRSALGIHYDPSFNKKNGEDGTSGCIALQTRDELSQVLEYVRTYKPQFIDVAIK
jgi:L,D-transpeptidase catalytic domain